MIEFTEHQRCRLAAAFGEVHLRLVEATQALDLDVCKSPFSTVIGDATPIQQRLIADYSEQCRDAMAALAERYAAPPLPPHRSALQTARNALDRAVVAIEELGPRYLCAYGPLTDDLESELNRIVSQLLDPLYAMRDVLASAPLPVEQIDSTRGDAILVKELACIVERHGLSELRPSLDALVERFKRDDLEIAAFGRVNSGKSSLLNAFLGSDVLPVGITPVTAVDVHVVYGREAWGFANFADAAAEKFELGRLPEFAAEHFNPSNLRHAIRLRVEVPALVLANRLTLVDTPGIPLDGRGASAFLAGFVPRCDIGLVLIDAAAGLGLEEAAIVSALHRAGSKPMVVIAKADRLPANERWAVHGLVERGLSAMSGFAVPVFFASSTAEDPALRSDWLDRGLRPLMASREALHARSMHGKLDRLRDAAVAAIGRRLTMMRHAAGSDAMRRAADAAVAEANAGLRAAGNPFNPRAEADRQTAALIAEVAHNAIVIWSQSDESLLDVTTLLVASLQARAASVARGAGKEVTKVHARCRLALAALGTSAGTGRCETTDIAQPNGTPVFDGTQCVQTTTLPRPAFGFLGRRFRSRSARRWLSRSSLAANIADAMAAYFAHVDAWRRQAIDGLRDGFETKRCRLETVRLERSQPGPTWQDREAQSLATDLERLKRSATSSAPFSGDPARGHTDGASTLRGAAAANPWGPAHRSEHRR